MGLRGPLAEIVATEPEPLDDISPPDWLDKFGKEFWEMHADWLALNGILNKQTSESFALCCSLWSESRQTDGKMRLDARRMFMSLAKLFRLLPGTVPGHITRETRHNAEEFEFS